MRFKRPKNTLEGEGKKSRLFPKDKSQTKDKKEKASREKVNKEAKINRESKDHKESKEEIYCKKCKKYISRIDLEKSLHICPFCNHHFMISPKERIKILCDENSFVEHNQDLKSVNILDFPDYDAKLEKAIKTSGENESVLCGLCSIGGCETAIFIMNGEFMMGSMGQITGEKISRLFEYATDKSLPVLGFSLSGGARMQEGIISLMQMAKVSSTVKRHSDQGNLYICVLTNPTSGGVTASFAMQADIILAEPDALVCFAGPRVIEQTIRKKVPEELQRATSVMENGFIDDIVSRKAQKTYLGLLLKMHERKEVKNASI